MAVDIAPIVDEIVQGALPAVLAVGGAILAIQVQIRILRLLRQLIDGGRETYDPDGFSSDD